MRLTHLSICGVRSIVAPLSLSFPKNGLFLIKGENGVGKSSILMAIANLLGFCPIPATALQSWSTEDKFEIIGRFEDKNGGFIVSRGKNPYVLVNGEQIKGAKAVDAKLLELFRGLDSDLRRLLTYRPQRKPGMFLSLPDAKKKEFLGAVIPELSKYEKAIDAFEEEVELLEDEQKRKQATKDAAVDLLASLGKMSLPEPLDLSIDEASLSELASEIEKRTLLLENLKQSEAHVINSVNVDELRAQGVTVMAHLTSVKEKISKSIQTLGSLKQKYGALDLQKRRLLACVDHNEKLKAGNCPTCNQSWVKHAEALANGEKEQAVLIVEVKQLMGLPALISAEEQNIAQLTVKQTELRNFAEEIAKHITGAREQAVAGLRKDILAALEQLQLLKDGQNELSRRVVNAKNEYDTKLKLHNQNKDLFDRYNANFQRAEEAYKEATINLNVKRDCLALTKGFFNSIFDDILIDISGRTNKILERIDNVSEVTVDFRSTYETAKKTIQRRITPYVTIRGHEAELEHGPSGGMYSSIESAVDLAVAEVVQHRSGFAPGFLILDEPFTGVSLKSKEAILEVLQIWAQDRLVIVVDHEGGFQGLFANVVEVVNSNGTTAIKENS